MSPLTPLPSLVVPTSVLFAFACTLFGLRLHTRITTAKLGPDDWFLIAGMVMLNLSNHILAVKLRLVQVAGLGSYISCMIAVHNGVGHHIATLHLEQVSTISRLLLCISQFYVWATTFIKLSLGFTILRIQGHNRIWRQSMRALMAFLSLVALVASLWDFLQCRPLKAQWDYSYSRDHCATTAYRIWMYIGSSRHTSGYWLYFLY